MENLSLKILNIKYLGYSLSCIFLWSMGKAQAQVLEYLVPKDIVIQHAGSIGFFSAGIGYPVFKNKRGTVDFNYGYVPEARGGDLHILSAKFAYRPWEFKIKDGISLYPLNPGVFLSYHLGKKFDFHWDKDTYEEGYYWWSTALRPHISFSTELKLDALKVFKTSKVKGISLYSEFNTNELYLSSYYKNAGAISLTEIFKLGVGVRVHL
jgi:hypothetical protein